MKQENQPLTDRIERLSGYQFEEFCVSMLSATGTLPFLGGTLIHADRHARTGQKQDGVDIRCELERGGGNQPRRRVTVVAQCKRVKKWSVQDTLDAIKDTSYAADECVLILALPTDGKIQKVIDQHNQTLPHDGARWFVWFSDTIRRHIERALNNDKGARFLTEYFGAPLAFEVTGISSPSAVMVTDAVFSGMPGFLQHQQKLEGRAEELQQLVQFLENENQRSLILTAEGGQGKTRLLAELARQVEANQPKTCIRWLTECTPDSLRSALQWLPPADRLIFILDDIHRWTQEPDGIFQVLSSQGPKLKIIIGTRPHRRAEITQALIRVEILSELQCHLQPLAPLKRNELRNLATAVLSDGRKSLATDLVRLSGGSPLILLLGADFLNRAPGGRNLIGDSDFRKNVLTKLIDAQKWAKATEIKAAKVERWLHVLALLSSAPLSESEITRRDQLAGLTDEEAEQLKELFRREGFLQSSEHDGKTAFRLVPDLMADYLAVDASFDREGKVRPLPAKVWEQFGSDQLLPILLRNLSEAEYIMRLSRPLSKGVTAPLMAVLKKQYRSGSWVRRMEWLKVWKSIALFHPLEALDQVRQAISLADILPEEAEPSATDQWLDSFFDSPQPPGHKEILQVAADLLAIIGATYPEHTQGCLDLLWDMATQVDHTLLSRIKDVCSLTTTRQHRSAWEGMIWIESRLIALDQLGFIKNWSLLLDESLSWCFDLISSETYALDSETLETETIFYPLTPTRKFRRRALFICETWFGSDWLPARLAAARFFKRFLIPDRMAVKKSQGGSATHRKAWKEEEREALSVLEKVIRETSDPSTLWAIRQTLIDSLPYVLHEKSGRHPLHDILENFPDSPDLRVHQLFLCSEHNDLWDSVEHCRKVALFQNRKDAKPFWKESSFLASEQRKRESWQDLVKTTTQALLTECTNAAALSSLIKAWQARLSELGYPNFGALYQVVLIERPTLFDGFVTHILADCSGELDSMFDQLLRLAGAKHPARESWTLEALQSPRTSLVLAAITSLKYQKAISPQVWECLTLLATREAIEIRLGLLHLAESLSAFEEHGNSVFSLLAGLHIQEDEKELWSQLIKCLLNWLRSPKLTAIPNAGREILKRLVKLPDWYRFHLDNLIVAWSRMAPEQVISFLEARLSEASRRDLMKDSTYQALPFNLQLHSLESVPGIAEKIATAFRSLENRDSNASQDLFGTMTLWFQILALGAWPSYLHWLETQLATLTAEPLRLALAPIRHQTRLAFTHPELCEKLLLRAEEDSDKSTVEWVREFLISSLHPGAHGFTPGTPRTHDLENREQAFELSKQYRNRPLLHRFYSEVQRYCEKAICKAKVE